MTLTLDLTPESQLSLRENGGPGPSLDPHRVAKFQGDGRSRLFLELPSVSFCRPTMNPGSCRHLLCTKGCLVRHSSATSGVTTFPYSRHTPSLCQLLIIAANSPLPKSIFGITSLWFQGLLPTAEPHRLLGLQLLSRTALCFSRS